MTLDELAVIGNDPIRNEQRLRFYNAKPLRIYTPEDIEGFKILFGEDEPVVIEPESKEAF